MKAAPITKDTLAPQAARYQRSRTMKQPIGNLGSEVRDPLKSNRGLFNDVAGNERQQTFAKWQMMT